MRNAAESKNWPPESRQQRSRYCPKQTPCARCCPRCKGPLMAFACPRSDRRKRPPKADEPIGHMWFWCFPLVQRRRPVLQDWPRTPILQIQSVSRKQLAIPARVKMLMRCDFHLCRSHECAVCLTLLGIPHNRSSNPAKVCSNTSIPSNPHFRRSRYRGRLRE
jgi:hypothetical protein